MSEFLATWSRTNAPARDVIVLGEGAPNGRDPRARIFGADRARAGRTFWRQPEMPCYWKYGDSGIAAYEQYARGSSAGDAQLG